MFEHEFDRETLIDSEEVLRRTFGTDRLYLKPGGSVVFRNHVELGSEIVFAGACDLVGDLVVENGCILENVSMGAGNRIRAHSVVSDLRAGERNLFGPFCFVRDHCSVQDDCILGAHVEAARSRFSSGVKLSHRAFVGDAEIGENTIIGAGVVFCNYDGAGRQRSVVGARVTLGSGTLLVAPLRIGDDAVIGAGATLTKDVPAAARIIQKR